MAMYLGLGLNTVMAFGPAHGGSPAALGPELQSAQHAIVDIRQLMDLRQIAAQLDDYQVIYIGELHDRFGHHLAQLELIRYLHARDPTLAIGMEMFQRPVQPYLDQWVAGKLGVYDMLKKTEWYERWGYDYRLYQPILEYARTHHVPIIALNAPRELTRRISAVGLGGLDDEESAELPATYDRSDADYEARLRQVFDEHPTGGSQEFGRFIDVQLTWDETMAESVSRFLEQNPGRRMVVLAGAAHIRHGSGIPKRARRNHAHDYSIILPADAQTPTPGAADFLIFTDEVELPKPPLMGVSLDTTGKQVSITAVMPDGAAERAGIQPGDIITALDGSPVSNYPDIRLIMFGKKPGDSLAVTVLRKRLFGGEETLEFELVLPAQ